MTLRKIFDEIMCDIYRLKYPFIYKYIHQLKILGIENTITSLIKNNKSLSRFGDGEIKWILGVNNRSFEKPSKLLSKRLINVLQSNDDRLAIGLPDKFKGLYPFNYKASRYWEATISKYGIQFLKYLNLHKVYYDAGITRPYMEYKDKYRKNSKHIFDLLKQIWNNKKLLIVEGHYSRLGVGNDLFSNAKLIKRIECPAINAFEHYNSILNSVIRFLRYNKDYLTLFALGPTATILVYDLLKYNYRSLDIGHIDVEYEWCLMHSKRKVNIPTRYVNEAKNNKMIPIHNKKYDNQIIKIIR